VEKWIESIQNSFEENICKSNQEGVIFSKNYGA